VKPADGSLSTDMVVFDTTVTVACDVGFKHADGQLVKFVRCQDSQIWNDTFTDCQGIALYRLQSRLLEEIILVLLLTYLSVC